MLVIKTGSNRLSLLCTFVGSVVIHGLVVLLIYLIEDSHFNKFNNNPNKFIEVSLGSGSEDTKNKIKGQSPKLISKSIRFKPESFNPLSSLGNRDSLSQKIRQNKDMEVVTPKIKADTIANKFTLNQDIINNYNPKQIMSESLTIPGYSHSVALQAIDVDPILSYTFMYRFGKAVYPRWINHLQIAFKGVAQEELLFYPYKQTLTVFEMLMDHEGHLVKLILLQSCGIESLDRSAARALYEAKKFPNPPQFLKQEDNLYRLKVTFNVILAK